MAAEIEGDFVVFPIGMRINRWWKFHKWLLVAKASATDAERIVPGT